MPVLCRLSVILGGIAGAGAGTAQQVPPGAPETPYVDRAKAYLFAI